MMHSHNSIHNKSDKKNWLKHLRNEKGHMIAMEWSYLFVVFALLIVILLPDIVNIGRTMMDTHGSTSYAIQRTAEQGHMTSEIATDVIDYLDERSYGDFEVYGTGTMVGMNEDDPIVTVKVVNRYRPMILTVIPDIRVSDSLEMADGVVEITSIRQDMSNVYVR